MKSFTFRGMGYGVGPDVLNRRLRASDLPIPTTNAQADRLVRDQMTAHHRELLRVSGFGDGEAVDGGDAAAIGGSSSAGFLLGSGGGLGKAVLVGVGVTVGASIALRFIESLWGRR